jgi:hypothetical protein
VSDFAKRERRYCKRMSVRNPGAAEKMAALTLDFMWWCGGEVKEQRRSRRLTLDLRLIRNCGS